jgi:hypothetical protein
LLIFIREEEAQGKRETIDKLGQKLVRNYAPSPEEIREISRILWHADGWSLVDFLMAGLELNRENALRDPTTVSGYIIELRRRLLLDWSTVDDWASWWQQNEGDSIETILAASQRAYVKRRVALWRKNLRRFRDLADPAAYFKALEESFASDSLEEARIAVLDELAEFPSWLKELRLDLATFDEAAREKLLESGVELLLEVLEGIGAYTHESISVRTSTMAALGAFAEVIGDRDDSSVRGEFREKVVAALLRDRDTHEPLDLTAWDEDGHQYRVEFIRTVGLLGVSEVHESLRVLLEKSATAVSKEDFAVLQEAVASLGKILKGNKIADVNRDVSQILALYELARARDERAKKDRQNQYSLRGLRKTCINAVHLPVTDSETLLEVRGVYRKILSPYAKDVPERIPAIIGLGILAENDEASRQVLISVLNERDEYEPNEVNTAVNALAYLGDRKALGCFVEFLPARDRPFADQVWKRAVNILKRGSPELRAWLVAELEKSGFESGSTDYAWVIVGLGKEPGLEGLFLSEKNNWDDIESLWRSALSEIAALGLLGQEDGAIARVEQLRRFWARNNKVVKLRRVRQGSETEEGVQRCSAADAGGPSGRAPGSPAHNREKRWESESAMAATGLGSASVAATPTFEVDPRDGGRLPDPGNRRRVLLDGDSRRVPQALPQVDRRDSSQVTRLSRSPRVGAEAVRNSGESLVDLRHSFRHYGSLMIMGGGPFLGSSMICGVVSQRCDLSSR